MSTFRRVTGVVLGSALLFGCATPKPRPPAITSIAPSQICSERPSLTSAIPVPYKPEEDVKYLSISIDENSLCLQGSKGKSLYKVLKLPNLAPPYIISLRSLPHGQGIFSPSLTLLDETGKKIRTIDRNKFNFRGSSLSAIFRINAKEKYLVATSDNGTVGKSYQHADDRLTRTTVSSGGMFAGSFNQGYETMHHATYSHGGILEVLVRPIANRKAK